MMLKGEPGTVEINILRRSNTTAVDYWDANWLEAAIKINVPGFEAHYETNLRVDDLQRFYTDLINIVSFTKNSAVFTTMEEGFYLKCAVGSNGGVSCHGNAINNSGNKLEFQLQTDIPSVQHFASQLEYTLRAYPLIGNADQ